MDTRAADSSIKVVRCCEAVNGATSSASSPPCRCGAGKADPRTCTCCGHQVCRKCPCDSTGRCSFCAAHTYQGICVNRSLLALATEHAPADLCKKGVPVRLFCSVVTIADAVRLSNAAAAAGTLTAWVELAEALRCGAGGGGSASLLRLVRSLLASPPEAHRRTEPAAVGITQAMVYPPPESPTALPVRYTLSTAHDSMSAAWDVLPPASQQLCAQLAAVLVLKHLLQHASMCMTDPKLLHVSCFSIQEIVGYCRNRIGSALVRLLHSCAAADSAEHALPVLNATVETFSLMLEVIQSESTMLEAMDASSPADGLSSGAAPAASYEPRRSFAESTASSTDSAMFGEKLRTKAVPALLSAITALLAKETVDVPRVLTAFSCLLRMVDDADLQGLSVQLWITQGACVLSAVITFCTSLWSSKCPSQLVKLLHYCAWMSGLVSRAYTQSAASPECHDGALLLPLQQLLRTALQRQCEPAYADIGPNALIITISTVLPWLPSVPSDEGDQFATLCDCCQLMLKAVDHLFRNTSAVSEDATQCLNALLRFLGEAPPALARASSAELLAAIRSCMRRDDIRGSLLHAMAKTMKAVMPRMEPIDCQQLQATNTAILELSELCLSIAQRSNAPQPAVADSQQVPGSGVSAGAGAGADADNLVRAWGELLQLTDIMCAGLGWLHAHAQLRWPNDSAEAATSLAAADGLVRLVRLAVTALNILRCVLEQRLSPALRLKLLHKLHRQPQAALAEVARIAMAAAAQAAEPSNNSLVSLLIPSAEELVRMLCALLTTLLDDIRLRKRPQTLLQVSPSSETGDLADAELPLLLAAAAASMSTLHHLVGHLSCSTVGRFSSVRSCMAAVQDAPSLLCVSAELTLLVAGAQTADSETSALLAYLFDWMATSFNDGDDRTIAWCMASWTALQQRLCLRDAAASAIADMLTTLLRNQMIAIMRAWCTGSRADDSEVCKLRAGILVATLGQANSSEASAALAACFPPALVLDAPVAAANCLLDAMSHIECVDTLLGMLVVQLLAVVAHGGQASDAVAERAGELLDLLARRPSLPTTTAGALLELLSTSVADDTAIGTIICSAVTSRAADESPTTAPAAVAADADRLPVFQTMIGAAISASAHFYADPLSRASGSEGVDRGRSCFRVLRAAFCNSDAHCRRACWATAVGAAALLSKLLRCVAVTDRPARIDMLVGFAELSADQVSTALHLGSVVRRQLLSQLISCLPAAVPTPSHSATHKIVEVIRQILPLPDCVNIVKHLLMPQGWHHALGIDRSSVPADTIRVLSVLLSGSDKDQEQPSAICDAILDMLADRPDGTSTLLLLLACGSEEGEAAICSALLSERAPVLLRRVAEWCLSSEVDIDARLCVLYALCTNAELLANDSSLLLIHSALAVCARQERLQPDASGLLAASLHTAALAVLRERLPDALDSSIVSAAIQGASTMFDNTTASTPLLMFMAIVQLVEAAVGPGDESTQAPAHACLPSAEAESLWRLVNTSAATLFLPGICHAAAMLTDSIESIVPSEDYEHLVGWCVRTLQAAAWAVPPSAWLSSLAPLLHLLQSGVEGFVYPIAQLLARVLLPRLLAEACRDSCGASRQLLSSLQPAMEHIAQLAPEIVECEHMLIMIASSCCGDKTEVPGSTDAAEVSWAEVRAAARRALQAMGNAAR